VHTVVVNAVFICDHKGYQEIYRFEWKHACIIFQGICIFALVCIRQSDVKRIWWPRM